MTIKINLSFLKKKIEHYVKEYYSLTTKPVLEEPKKEMSWIKDMIAPFIEFTIISLELNDIKRIDVHERMVNWNHQNTQSKCVQKKGYEIEKALGEYSDKFLLKGNKTAKVKVIYLWEYKQKNEMKSVINNEFKICKKAEALGIGPKTLDTFICYNSVANYAYKVVVSEYIPGLSLKEWLDKDPSQEERKRVHSLVKAKIDKMHENGIIHSSLYRNNVILKEVRGKVVDAFITDFVNSYDVQDKTMWSYNSWIQRDRNVLDLIVNKTYSYNNADDVVKYVVSKVQKYIVVT